MSPSCSSETWRISVWFYPRWETWAGNVVTRKWRKMKKKKKGKQVAETLGPKIEQHLKDLHQLQPGEMKQRNASLLLTLTSTLESICPSLGRAGSCRTETDSGSFSRTQLSFRFDSDIRIKSYVHKLLYKFSKCSLSFSLSLCHH